MYYLIPAESIILPPNNRTYIESESPLSHRTPIPRPGLGVTRNDPPTNSSLPVRVNDALRRASERRRVARRSAPPRQPDRPSALHQVEIITRTVDENNVENTQQIQLNDSMRQSINQLTHELVDSLSQQRPAQVRPTIDTLLTHTTLSVHSTNEGEDSVQCSICHNELQENCIVRRLGCNHSFHSGCIDRWLISSNTCPICRVRVDGSREEMPDTE